MTQPYDTAGEARDWPLAQNRNSRQARHGAGVNSLRDARYGGRPVQRNESVDRSAKSRRPDEGFGEAGVDELAAPEPVGRDRPEQTHRQPQNGGSASNPRRLNSGFGDAGVDELAAPEVVERDRPEQMHLEDRRNLMDYHYGLGPSERSVLLQHSITISYLVFFAIWGTLARLGLQWLTFYPGAPITTPVLWANVGGSWFMGFLSEDRRLFQHPFYDPDPKSKRDMSPEDQKAAHGKLKKTIPLYIGLATGFCGSFTSFSSFMRDAFLAISNNIPSPLYHPIAAGAIAPSFSSVHPRDAGYSVLAVLAVLLFEPGLSLCALFVGAHTAMALDRVLPGIPYRISRGILDPAILFLGPACWLGAVLLALFAPDRTWRGEALFALVFAPPGCLLRFYASLKLNPLLKSFPMGTFAVNMFGAAVLALCYDMQHLDIGGVAGGAVVACQVLQGLQDGFCGCLTTVSTWVAEVQGLGRRHAYVYGVTTLAVGLAVMVVIMGSVRWSLGWVDASCTTSRTSS